MTADDAKATLSKSEMYAIRPIMWWGFDGEDPEADRENLQQGTLYGLYANPKTGHPDPFRVAHILNDSWIEFHRKFMLGFAMARVHLAPVRSMDGEAFCREMWQELNKSLSGWCAMHFVNSDGSPALDMTPQQVIEDVEYVGSC